MALYLMLTTLTEKGVQTLNSNPARVREVNRDVEELGAKILHQWASLGAYDFVNVVEAPDDLTIAKVSVALGARGSSKIESLPLVSVDDAALSLERKARQLEPRGSTRRANPVARATHRERARGKPTRGIQVEPSRRDVVRRLRVEECRQELDLVAADPELELTAAVRADPLLGAVVVGAEELRHGTEARRLDVHRARRPAEAPRCRRPSGSPHPR